MGHGDIAVESLNQGVYRKRERDSWTLAYEVILVQLAEMENWAYDSLALIAARYTYTAVETTLQRAVSHLIFLCQTLSCGVHPSDILA